MHSRLCSGRSDAGRRDGARARGEAFTCVGRRHAQQRRRMKQHIAQKENDEVGKKIRIKKENGWKRMGRQMLSTTKIRRVFGLV
jgi:hypothetical protein